MKAVFPSDRHMNICATQLRAFVKSSLEVKQSKCITEYPEGELSFKFTCLFIYFYRYLICWPKTLISRERRWIRHPGDRARASYWPHQHPVSEHWYRGWSPRPWSRRGEPERREYRRGARHQFWALELGQHHGGGDVGDYWQLRRLLYQSISNLFNS